MELALDIRRKSRSAAKRLAMSVLSYPAAQSLLFRIRPREKIFGLAYSSRAWGSSESFSGAGSEIAATRALQSYLPDLFERLGVGTFLDAPCGDWNWMRTVDLSRVQYLGADVVKKVVAENQDRYGRSNVSFMAADLTSDPLPRADLILCRDCLVHLSFEDIAKIINSFRRSGAKYLLLSNSPHVDRNTNKMTGLSWRHINLTLPPFNFPEPMEAIKDHFDDVPFYTSLWRMRDVPTLGGRFDVPS